MTDRQVALREQVERADMGIHAPPAERQDGGLLRLIERVTMDPALPMDRLDKLLDMQERMEARAALQEFDAAFSMMQPELPVIRKGAEIRDRNGKLRSTYARWEDINEQIGPVLGRHGFGLRFDASTADDSKSVSVVAILTHRGGHREKSPPFRVPVDMDAFMNIAQKIASATSYGKRYAAGAILNLTYRDVSEDDDAQSTSDTISTEQFIEIRDLLGSDDAIAKFCQFAGIQELHELPAKHYAESVQRIRKRNAELAQKRQGGAA